MTREQFISQKADSERRIRRRVVPMGIIYSIRVGSIFGVIYSAAFQWMIFGLDIQHETLIAIGFCILLFIASFPAERDSRSHFVGLALKCEYCQSCLVFGRAQKTLETGCCYHCGRQVFDL